MKLFVPLLLVAGFIGFLSFPGKALSADEKTGHCAEMNKEIADAVKHGEAGHADAIVEHAEAALKHAKGCEKDASDSAKPHVKEAIKHLEAAVDHGKAGHASIALEHAKTAQEHAGAVK